MDQKLNEAHYQPNHSWASARGIQELHKITNILTKDVKPSLAKQTFCQVHIPSHKEINLAHYDTMRPNEKHQFDFGL